MKEEREEENDVFIFSYDPPEITWVAEVNNDL